ncbi:bifunctional hydroxymethylpyrimidine kinase/phosphomethylpyrimidine kinase [Campylobacter sp. RM12651]|uniref:bifunctional hydroxymethylpyrimidine kinase/phosphomethylpyrimidine kinase n=1 Tax=Campylobacter sp. RM12651 TaxID=1660079 RepID=UPI001EFAC1FF|nr:bifunctional hydroxymethylpyrimidine kinase/phosphomethylpyrimidine kinase [Campylobacter sp. RM12651]ULO03864.1 hydroxymethylpyrimidine kinase / phosphohydroxymethylpyrimidine kinase [Campylobacter sp. RM12651]
MKKILSIAGSDPSGGAGLQADIKTIQAHKMYAMSVITALTAQNTSGVFGVLRVDTDFIKAQIKACFDECEIDFIKIGMLYNEEIINCVKNTLNGYSKIVLDPVMVSTSGARLLDERAINTIKDFAKNVYLITPNLYEAEVLLGEKITNEKDAINAAKSLEKTLNCKVLLKGGHLKASDFLSENGEITIFKGKKIKNIVTHGTGCTLSSAIACNLALNENIKTACKNAKDYVSNALKNSFNFNYKVKLLNHF